MTQRSHSPKQRALEAYAAGQLSEAGAARLGAHLLGCTLCQETLRGVVAYRDSVQVLHDQVGPQIDWRKIERAVTEAAVTDTRPAPAPRRWGGRAVVYPLLAAAAAAALAWLSSSEPAPDAVAPAPAPATAELTPAPLPKLTGTTVAVMGVATTQRAGQPLPLTVADEVREGDVLSTGARSVVDVLLADGSSLRLLADSSVAFRSLREGQITLELQQGVITQRVTPRSPGQVYDVSAESTQVQVVGTEFTVARDGAERSVSVHEGRVHVRDKEVDVYLEAGGAWNSTANAAQVPDRGPSRLPTADVLDTEVEGIELILVHAHLPEWPEAQTLTLGSAVYPHGSALAIRLPERPIELAVTLRNGQRVSAMWTPTVADPDLSLARMRRLLFGAQEPRAGELSAEQLQATLGPARPQWQRCYERALRSDPALSRDIMLRLDLAPSGTVRNCQIRGNVVPHSEFARCVDRVARSLVFPSPKGPFSFQFPLTFRARTP